MRQCLACRARREKRDLLRWTLTDSRCAVPDVRGKRPGRGGYLCRDEKCLSVLLARSRKRPPDFRREEQAFRLAIRGSLVQNGASESRE